LHLTIERVEDGVVKVPSEVEFEVPIVFSIVYSLLELQEDMLSRSQEYLSGSGVESSIMPFLHLETVLTFLVVVSMYDVVV